MKPETLAEAIRRTEKEVMVSFWLLQGAYAIVLIVTDAIFIYALWIGGFLDG